MEDENIIQTEGQSIKQDQPQTNQKWNKKPCSKCIHHKIADACIIFGCILALVGEFSYVRYYNAHSELEQEIERLEQRIHYYDDALYSVKYDNTILIEQKAVLEWQLENAEKEIEELKSQLEQPREDQPQQLPGNIQAVPDEQSSENEVYEEETEVKPADTISKTDNTDQPQNNPSTDNNSTKEDSPNYPDYMQDWDWGELTTPEDQEGRGSVEHAPGDEDITFTPGG